MGGYSEKDAAKDTNSSMKETKDAWHTARDDAAEEGDWGVPKDRHGEGCFIATAAYGSYFEPHVKILRDFRDIFLVESILGRLFIKIYYCISPFISGIIEKSEILKKIMRIILSPIALLIEHIFIKRF
ncbi:hypothetical protein HZC33_01130 [Candidatus Wolfebacteria bacterium]|nr:hypothetical protein [Candidatus Wolfebacteria bacterium]